MSRRFNRRRIKGICEIMKIRELFEDVNLKKQCDIEYAFYFPTAMSLKTRKLLISKTQASKIIDDFFRRPITKSVTNISFESFNFILKDVEFLLDNDKKQSDFLYDVVEKVRQLNKHLTNHEYHVNIILSINFIPEKEIKFPTEFGEIAGQLDCTNLDNLKNMNVFENFNQISILNCQNIKRNVLSILQLKWCEIYFNFLEKRKYEWIKIIDEYQNSKDILQCQEDLIDAGLREFAKL